MAHYAFLDTNNIVTEVITGRNENEVVDGISDWESHYAEFRPGLICKRTSYNTLGGVHLYGGTPFRKNFAGIGCTYDSIRDAFIPPRPVNLNSWVLNEDKCLWEAPIPYPNDGGIYEWNEEILNWEELAE
jgi:hypothetical protein